MEGKKDQEREREIEGKRYEKTDSCLDIFM